MQGCGGQRGEDRPQESSACEPLALQGTGCVFRLVVWVHAAWVGLLCFFPRPGPPPVGVFTCWGGVFTCWVRPQGKALLCSWARGLRLAFLGVGVESGAAAHRPCS